MVKYFCKECDLVFESQTSKRKDYADPVFGPCWKYISECPKCGKECSEKHEKKQSKGSGSAIPSYPQNNCGQGGCCCN